MTLRWGFMGAARIARSALAPAVQAAGHSIDAVAARDLVRAQQFATEFGIPRAYEGYEALVADPALDAIYIALANDTHLPWTLKALEAGKHVLCEKPLALNGDEVALIQQAEQASGRRVMEAYCHVHHPQIAGVREIVSSGALGRLVAMHASHANPLLRTGDFRWLRAMGGGAMLDLGCYCLSAMRVLSGLEPVRVSAIAAMRGDVDATFWGNLEFQGGVGAQLMCSMDGAKSQHLTLLGTEGMVSMDWPYSTRDRVASVELNGVVEPFALTNVYVTMVQHFADVVSGRAEMLFPIADSLKQARAHDALLQAADSGIAVTVAR